MHCYSATKKTCKNTAGVQYKISTFWYIPVQTGQLNKISFCFYLIHIVAPSAFVPHKNSNFRKIEGSESGPKEKGSPWSETP